MIDKTIKIACQGAKTLKLEQLNILQKDLKSLSHDDYEKYKSEIINTGYAFPIKAWYETSSNKWWIVGGTQSFRVLTEMSNDGWNIPEIPISVINAKDKKEAMRRVLQDASSYGTMESDGLYEFLQLAEMNIEDFNKSFRTPEIDHDKFMKEFQEQPINEKELDENIETEHECPKCGYVY